MRQFASSIAVAAAVLAFSVPAATAGSVTTWVSHNGSDANTGANPPCDPQFPCLTLATTIFNTTVGGTVSCLDNGEYGGLGTPNGLNPPAIFGSMTIDCSAQGGTISVTGNSNGITIEPIVAGARVKLRGLTINGNGATGHGVLIQNAAEVIIENCVIQNFNGAGIFVQTNSGSALQLQVADTLIADNASSGIIIGPSAGTATNFVFERIRVANNTSGGIQVFPNQATGAVTGLIRDSVVTGNPPYGIDVATNLGTPITVSLDHTEVTGNGFGIIASGSAVILNNSTIQQNSTGLSASANGAIFSYGNNAINGNQPGGTGTAPISIGLR
jgi:hypothetical protein